MNRYPAPRSTLVAAAAALLALAACGQKQPETPPGPSEQPAASPAEPAAAPTAAEAEASAQAADLAAREAELARREAELALKEREQAVARAEADLAAKQAAARQAAARAAAKAPAAPTPSSPAPAASAPAKPAPPPSPVVIPEGTQLAVELTQELSTKTAKVGQRFEARLASPVKIDDKVALPAATVVRGTVTEVVSGSHKIGGTPTLGLAFDEFQLADGQKLPMSGRLVEAGASDTGKDTAKIAGGAVLGAIIGHQIDSKKGKVVGALIGGAAGTIAAQNTGGEVVVPAGTVLGVALTAPVKVTPK